MAPTKQFLLLAIAACAVAVPSNHGRGEHAHLHQKHASAPSYGYNPNASAGPASMVLSAPYPQDNCTSGKDTTASATGGYVNVTTTFTDTVEPTVNPTHTPPVSYGPPPSYLSAHSSATVAAAPESSAGPQSGSGAPASSPVDAANASCEERDVTVYTTITLPCTVYETGDQAPSLPTSTAASSIQAVQLPAPAPAAPSSAQSASASPLASAEITSVPKAYSPPASIPASAALLSSSDTITFSSAAKQQETPAVASSSTQAKPTAYAPSPSSSGKRGLAYNDVSLLKCFADSSLLTWGYNWAMKAETAFPSNMKYIPMIWGTKASINPGNWNDAATAAIASGAEYLMSFNEPDMASQANMNPADAAASYKQYMQPFAGKAKLIAPSISSTDASASTPGNPVGLAWLGNFTQACQGCTFDAFNLHWYGPAGGAAAFKQHVQTAQQQFQAKEIFITEFGLYDGVSDDDISTFLKDVMPWMDSQDYVVGYSYFMVASGMLVTGSEPSTYGKIYANYTG